MNPDRAKVFKRVKTLLRKNDTFRTIEFVNGLGDPLSVAKKYSELVMDLYWKEHSVKDIIIIARAGIQYCLTMAQKSKKGTSKKAVQLRSIAKVMAYNLASFTWPGWNEKGIHISQSDLDVGLDAAKLNLRLARELKRGTMPLSMAHWVLGAQYMAAGKYDKAIKSFVSSRNKARAGKNRMSEWLADGYIGVAKIVRGRQKISGKRQLDKAMEGLKKIKTEDSKFYIRQLKTALKVFKR